MAIAPQEINRRFKEYYKTLCPLEVFSTPNDSEVLFNKLNLPATKIGKILEKPISHAQILAAINKNGHWQILKKRALVLTFIKTSPLNLVDKL